MFFQSEHILTIIYSPIGGINCTTGFTTTFGDFSSIDQDFTTVSQCSAGQVCSQLRASVTVSGISGNFNLIYVKGGVLFPPQEFFHRLKFRKSF